MEHDKPKETGVTRETNGGRGTTATEEPKEEPDKYLKKKN